MAYEDGVPFPFNNFIYKVDLISPATELSFKSGEAQPCTSPPPPGGVSTLIFRISNPVAIGLNNANRLENEVASLHLTRVALEQAKPEYATVIPSVYSWKPSSFPEPANETAFGWIIMEFKTGVSLDSVFKDMPLDEKKAAVEQIADIFCAIQKMNLPTGVTGHGGLTIDRSGDIISAEMSTLKGGPWTTYADSWTARLSSQLAEADGSVTIKGWRPGGVRERVDRFMESGVEAVLKTADVDTSKLAFVHGDLSGVPSREIGQLAVLTSAPGFKQPTTSSTIQRRSVSPPSSTSTSLTSLTLLMSSSPPSPTSAATRTPTQTARPLSYTIL